MTAKCPQCGKIINSPSADMVPCDCGIVFKMDSKSTSPAMQKFYKGVESYIADGKDWASRRRAIPPQTLDRCLFCKNETFSSTGKWNICSECGAVFCALGDGKYEYMPGSAARPSTKTGPLSPGYLAWFNTLTPLEQEWLEGNVDSTFPTEAERHENGVMIAWLIYSFNAEHTGRPIAQWVRHEVKI